jgi:hypothetical protein
LRRRHIDGACERHSKGWKSLHIGDRQDEEAECGLESGVGRRSIRPIGGEMEGVGKRLDVVDQDGGQAVMVHMLS